MSELSNGTIILIFIFFAILSNWFAGFISMNFTSPRYEISESSDYLAVYGFTLLKLIRPTKSYQVQSDILHDSRTIIRKLYSTRSLHILIVQGNQEKKTKVLWVELIKSWNISSSSRKINYFLETNNKILDSTKGLIDMTVHE